MFACEIVRSGCWPAAAVAGGRTDIGGDHDLFGIRSAARGEPRRGAMDAPFFHELRRQASSYLTGKIRSARLALTDVTLTQL